MTNQRRRAWHRWLAVCALLVTGLGAKPALAASPPVACDSLAGSLKVDGVRLASSTPVDAGQFTPDPSMPGYQVPAFCRIRGVASPSADSAIAFEVWVPLAGWNGKLEIVGNGGYAGQIGYEDMAGALARGYATAGGDSGHTGPDNDLSFVIGHHDKMVDWGYRSVHAVLEAARPLVAASAGREAERTYYFGCSTGGGQGLAELQRYPDDFDGAVLGAPGNNRTRLNAYFLWMYAANHQGGKEIIPASKLPMITQAAIDGCDQQTGSKDGFFDGAACKFDPAKLLCSGTDTGSCLTAAQVGVLQAIYDGPVNPRTGAKLFAGGNPSSESGWANYINGPEPARTDFWRYWVLGNPTWHWQEFDFDRDVSYADALVGPVVNNNDADLSAYKAHGGKLIEYQGEADPIAPVGDTLSYYQAVLKQQGSQPQMDGFYRLFLAPGMAHCHGGPGPNVLGNQGTTPPQIDAQHDLTAALDQWVREGTAPDAIIAVNVNGGAVTRSRPLCKFPNTARYTGTGDRSSAANWQCQVP